MATEYEIDLWVFDPVGLRPNDTGASAFDHYAEEGSEATRPNTPDVRIEEQFEDAVPDFWGVREETSLRLRSKPRALLFPLTDAVDGCPAKVEDIDVFRTTEALLGPVEAKQECMENCEHRWQLALLS